MYIYILELFDLDICIRITTIFHGCSNPLKVNYSHFLGGRRWIMLPLYVRHFPPVHGLFGATLIYIYIFICRNWIHKWFLMRVHRLFHYLPGFLGMMNWPWETYTETKSVAIMWLGNSDSSNCLPPHLINREYVAPTVALFTAPSVHWRSMGFSCRIIIITNIWRVVKNLTPLG